MKRPRILFPLCLAACLSSHILLAAQDPSDIFVQALLASQSAEKLKADGKSREALQKFRFAAGLLDQIRADSPKWQPLVREYRSKKTAENIAELEAMNTRDKTLAPPAVEPALPTDNSLIPGADNNPTPAASPDTTDLPEDTTSGPAGSAEAAELRRQIAEARLEIKRLRAANIDLTQKYELSSGNLRDALKRVDQGRVAVAELRSQLAQTDDRLRSAMASRTQDATAIAALKTSVTSLQQKITERTADTNLVEDEANDLGKTVTQANQRATEASQERDSAVKEKQEAVVSRDQALADLQKVKNDKEASDKAIAANAELTSKLDAAEKKIAELNQRPQPADLEALKTQIADIQKQLVGSQEQTKNYATNVEELKSQLADSNKALEEARRKSPSSDETVQLKSENDLLRGIVLRTVKEQIKRNQAREIVAEELARIEGKSQTLLDQIDVLGSATLSLTDDERKLFKEPEIASLETRGPGLSVVMDQKGKNQTRQNDSNNTAAAASPTPTPAASGNPANPAVVSTVNAGNASPTPNLTVPDKYASLVSRARSFFEKGDFSHAESAYNEILSDDPNNLYALSNLGVVHYKAGKLPQSEKDLVKAATLSPKDFFVNCTLGIVYYREGKFEKAIESLTTAITIDPTSATAHNYLGIAASQKGWIEAAIKELEKATTLNPNYPDAFFNLSVVYATSQPPSLDKARDSYRKAIDLGAQPDPSLEKLFK